MFIGAVFILRALLEYHLWREKLWYRWQWVKSGDFAFLRVLLIATFWHVN